MHIDESIISFYDQSDESERLHYGLGPLELERNQEIISRYLPEKPIAILDVGGGPGIYAEWLANQGHHIVLLDPVDKHIKQAKDRSSRMDHPFAAIKGMAESLPVNDDSIDLVLLHGPLYHLQKQEERLIALKESKRVLKPGGVLLAWGITHTASTLVGLIQGNIEHQAIFDMCIKELQTGIHQAPPNMPGILESAYYHRPDEIREEICKIGFEHKKTLPVEGMVWLHRAYFTTRSDSTAWKLMKKVLEVSESDPSLLPLSPHIVAIAQKPQA